MRWRLPGAPMNRWRYRLGMKTLLAACLLFARSIVAQSSVDPSQIEHRLHPARPDGTRSDSAFDLFDRMRLYHVPGVSIAIVDGSRIVFARGYGMTVFGGK